MSRCDEVREEDWQRPRGRKARPRKQQVHRLRDESQLEGQQGGLCGWDGGMGGSEEEERSHQSPAQKSEHKGTHREMWKLLCLMRSHIPSQ